MTWRATAPAPLVICQEELELEHYPARCPKRWYFWFFGLQMKLPFESEWKFEAISDDI